MFSFLSNRKAIVHEYATFAPTHFGKKLIKGSDAIISYLFSYNDIDVSDAIGTENIPMQTSTKCKWSKDSLRSYDFNDSKHSTYKLMQAYLKARQARFEHGETPTV